MSFQSFVDQAEFYVRAGDGGDGCTSFRSESHQPHGGPDGGRGGNGGDVIFEANEGLTTLTELSYSEHIEAEDGDDGGPKNQRGQNGEDTTVGVPPGTVVYNSETDEKIGELSNDEETLTVAEGGEGGRGNKSFVTSRRQAPSFHEYGTNGEEIHVRLELKLIADVGLVGAPNAGKSSILSSLTSADPKIAEHQFTTQYPNLGVLFRNHKQITLCDVPGLLEDAHKGVGMGLGFLRHVERTRILVHVVDISGAYPLDTYRAIEDELNAYGSELSEKPRLLVLNKVDRVDWEIVDIFMNEIDPPGPIVTTSAIEGTGLETLKNILWSINNIIRGTEENDDEFDRVITMEQDRPTTVQKIGDRYILRGDMVENLIKRFNLRNSEAQSYVREKLLAEGVHKKLEAEGCEPGDTIQVQDQVFNYTG